MWLPLGAMATAAGADDCAAVDRHATAASADGLAAASAAACANGGAVDGRARPRDHGCKALFCRD